MGQSPFFKNVPSLDQMLMTASMTQVTAGPIVAMRNASLAPFSQLSWRALNHGSAKVINDNHGCLLPLVFGANAALGLVFATSGA